MLRLTKKQLQGCGQVLPDWRVLKNFHLPNQKKTEDRGRKEKKTTLVKLANGFSFLLANPEFLSHLASGYPHP
jgi:hypothetical protein